MLVLYNASIYAPKQPKATAIAIDHGRFVGLGSDADILSGFSHATFKVDLQGRSILPGLTDSHVHLHHLADSMTNVDCETETREECLERVQQAADQTP